MSDDCIKKISLTPGGCPFPVIPENATCPEPDTTCGRVLVHTCNTVHPDPCTLVDFEDGYFISLIADATGNPNHADNKVNWAGEYTNLGSAIVALMALKATVNTDTNTTYQVVTNNNATQTFISSDPSVPDVLLNQTTPIPNTDTACKVTAFTNTEGAGETTVTETCINVLTNEVISTNDILVIQAGAVDTINVIANPNADGEIWFTRPDLTMVCTLDCDEVDNRIKCSKVKPFSAKRVLNSIFRQNLTNSDTTTDLERDVKTLAFEVTDGVAVSPAVPPFTVVEHVLNKDDFCAGDCDYNGLRLQVHARSNKQDTVNGEITNNVITTYEIDGGFSETDNVISAPTDGSDVINNEVDLIDMPFDSNGQITIRHIVQRFPALSEIDDGLSLLTVKARACLCLNTD